MGLIEVASGESVWRGMDYLYDSEHGAISKTRHDKSLGV